MDRRNWTLGEEHQQNIRDWAAHERLGNSSRQESGSEEVEQGTSVPRANRGKWVAVVAAAMTGAMGLLWTLGNVGQIIALVAHVR